MKFSYCSHAADKAAYERAGYGPHRDPLKPAGTYCCVFYSISTAARFTERERVPMRTVPCPLIRGNFSVTVNSNKFITEIQVVLTRLSCGTKLFISSRTAGK